VTHDGETRMVIQVTSDHRETAGGSHQCGYARHSAAATAGRPACDCTCSGARRQDAAGFTRTLAQSDLNHNNFYSQHSNLNYNENDQAYAGEKVSHFHQDS
jgi:hypothetical protein